MSPQHAEARPSTAREGVRTLRRVVVPVGGTDREFLAQEQAVEMAAGLGVPLTAVHVRSDPDLAPGDLFRFITEKADKWGVDLETQVRGGTDAAQELVGDLDALDLVVIGTRRMGRRYHIGSVAEHLVHHAPCPVQVVRLDA